MECHEKLHVGRYLLYLDVLGFKDLVRTQPADAIYRVLDDALKFSHMWEGLNQRFKTIYFSDTIILYQVETGADRVMFLDACDLGRMLLSALLAKGIPSRGCIAFGDFEARQDSSGRHVLFFGDALIEAYEAEQKENWIGISALPSAWIGIPGCEAFVAMTQAENRWLLRQDNVLLLNPFVKLRGTRDEDLAGEINVPFDKWNAPEFSNDLRGLRFIVDKTSRYASLGDYSSRIATKYHTTLAFLKDVLGPELFDWAERASRSLGDLKPTAEAMGEV